MENIQTKVKHIHFTSKDCPVVNENWGSLILMLDTVLCKGFNINSINKTENLTDNKVKVYIKYEHGYTKDLVISIYGSNEDYFNKEFRVLDTFSEGIIIQLDKSLTDIVELVSSETLKIKTAPLGYENVYTSVSKTTMCFRNTSQTSPGVIKVIDEIPPNGYGTNWSRFARVVIGKEIDAEGNFIDNQKIPYHPNYPDAEKFGNNTSGRSGVHGFAKWYYTLTNDAYTRESYGNLYLGAKSWQIIGDSNTFYLILNCGPDVSVLGFGNIKGNSDSNPIVLQASNSFLTAENTDVHGHYGKKNNNWGILLSGTGMFLLTDIGGNIPRSTSNYFCTGMYVGDNNITRPWRSLDIKNYNQMSGKLSVSKMYVKDAQNYIRGFHRGLNIFYGSDYPSAGRLLGTDYIIINITDPYRETDGGAMPLLFTLKDWEEV